VPSPFLFPGFAPAPLDPGHAHEIGPDIGANIDGRLLER
jgi:hypothetical protein